MNIKHLFQKPKPKKLNTATRRAAMPVAEDYDAEEPNVRLSRAFFVVMLLHIVAVGGIFLFSSLKKNTPSPLEQVAGEEVGVDVGLAPGETLYIVKKEDSLGSIANAYGLTRSDLESANRLASNGSIQTGDKLVIPAKSSAQPLAHDVKKLLQPPTTKNTVPVAQKVVNAPIVKTALPVSSATPSTSINSKAVSQIYVVEKGDNPASIAKKHGIKYASLIEANQITDPRKLQIGQKLIIPAQ